MATAGPLTVIDDSYNANPVGVHNGLEVLAAMSGGTKFLVTPGLVELGSVEDDGEPALRRARREGLRPRHRDVGEDQRRAVRRPP